MEYYSTIKKNEILALEAIWIDPEIIIPSEVKTEKDKYPMIPLIFGNLKNDAKELNYKTETDSQTENKLRATKGERQGVRFNSVQSLSRA